MRISDWSSDVCSSDLSVLCKYEVGMYIGEPIKRREDLRFLTGRGTYVGDLLPQNTCYIAFVRSPHAHAKICSVDVSQAESSEERRVGKECASTCRSRWSPFH